MTAHRHMMDSYKTDRETLETASGTNFTLQQSEPLKNEQVHAFTLSANTTVTLPYPLKAGLTKTIYIRSYSAGTLTLKNEGSEAVDAMGNTTLTLDAALEAVKFESYYDGTNFIWRLVWASMM